MEEILASIRRIIADDDASKASEAARGRARAATGRLRACASGAATAASRDTAAASCRRRRLRPNESGGIDAMLADLDATGEAGSARRRRPTTFSI